MQIFAFSKRSLGYFEKDKNPETGEGLLLTRISSFVKLEGRIYSLPKLQKSRRVTVSRPVCFGLQMGARKGRDTPDAKP